MPDTCNRGSGVGYGGVEDKKTPMTKVSYFKRERGGAATPPNIKLGGGGGGGEAGVSFHLPNFLQ